MSFKIEHPPRELWLVLALSSLMLWVFYLRTLSPAFPPDDSPETIVAAYTLGIQHPPGYPLAAMLGRTAMVALPIGAPAFRMNLLSAALGCLAAALAGALAFGLSRGERKFRLAGTWLCVLGVGSLGIYWEQATGAKGGIYLLNLGLGLGLWLATLNDGRRSAWLWSGLAGLMLANHYPSALLWILPTGLWVFGVRKAERRSLWALLPGLSLYLYLPLRAAQYPALNWGDPASWGQFWWVLARSAYSQAVVTDHAASSVGQLKAWALSLGQMGWFWVPLFAAAGADRLWREQRALARLLLGSLILCLAAALLVNKTVAENRWLCLIFALPGTVLLAPLAGAGVARALQAWGPAKPWRASALAFLGLWALSAQSGRADRSGSFVAWDYARDLSLSMPKGSLYLAEGDYHLLPFMHLQEVEGKRRDVSSALTLMCGEPWYQRLLERSDATLNLPGPGVAAQAAPEMARLNARRPVVLSPYSELLTPQSLGTPLYQRGLARSWAPVRSDFGAAWAARIPARSPAANEAVEAALLPWYTVALVQGGNEALAQGNAQRAAQDFKRALERPGPKPEGPLAFNLGLALEQAGQPAAAREAYARSLRVQPDFQASATRLRALDARP